MLQPYFNVVRSDFYRDSYVTGASEALAGHGLYGEYILLFPEAGLLNWTQRATRPPFPLEKVQDVLLRFDFVAVTKQPALSLQSGDSATE